MGDATLLRWCGALKLWPDGMKPTLDREALGIEVTDIEAETKKALEEAERVPSFSQCHSITERVGTPSTSRIHQFRLCD
jgi:hypothetical protein